MRNERMDLEEWCNLKFQFATDCMRVGETELGKSALSLLPQVEYYMWMRVIYCKHSPEVIFFDGCEYCENKSLDKNDCCTTCSAPVEM